MQLIIIPDIFGITPALETLARQLKEGLKAEPKPFTDFSMDILPPYDTGICFDDEQKAYAYFTAHLDIPRYSNMIKTHLETRGEKSILLGFSAGASAIWHRLGTEDHPLVSGAICFYGSQIRQFTHLNPHGQMDLIFPESESHFDVDSLMAELAEKPNTRCEKQQGGHGFMNACSKNFHPGLYTAFVREILPKKLNQTVREGMGSR